MQIELIDMKTEPHAVSEIAVISKILEQKMRECISKNMSVLLISSHRGRSNSVICLDCGEENVSKDKCGNCGSWRLKTFGIGIERIRKELVKIFGSNIENKVELLQDSQLPSLRESFSLVAIVSIDSILSIPSYDATERVAMRVIKAKELASDFFVVQTRHAENLVFKSSLHGEIAHIQAQEIESRRRFKYPPAHVIIKVTKQDKSCDIIRVPADKWPDQAIIRRLGALGNSVRIEVNPWKLSN